MCASHAHQDVVPRISVTTDSAAPKRSVCIVEASGQNVFFGELMNALHGALASAGMQVERAVDHFPRLGPGRTYVFVPHEYMPLVLKEAHPTERQLRRTVAICTEQPGTHWFEEAARVAAHAGAAVDINPLGAAELRRRGIEARHLQLGYVAEWDRWGGEDRAERPVDAVFMGGYTPRRGRALARCGSALASRRARLHLVDSAFPHLAESQHFLSGERRWSVLRDAKLMLNVHRGEFAYFEWLRVIGAMLNGCVLLTEHSFGFEPLVPGEHFISVSHDSLPAALTGLLADPQRISEVRAAAYRLVRDELPFTRTITPLLDALAEVAAVRVPLRSTDRAAAGPRPRALTEPLTEYERVFAQRSDIEVLRMATKQLLLGQRDLQRRLAEVAAATNGQPAPVDVVEQIGPREEAPRVSVVLTVHNYAAFVAAAVGSVALSDYASYELVVVDDASTDDSLAVVRRAVAAYPWLAVTLVSLARNRGLPTARNLGVEQARGEFVFILDADNVIYPHCLGRLVAALDAAPAAAFAYGILEQFGPDGPHDLISWHGWDPARLRHGNYVDAMALLRRSALLAVGGYTTEPHLYGWEDFAMWCEFAERGWVGHHVPEIVARYRTGLHSMIRITNIDSSTAWSTLVARNTFLTR
jgi:hypothetical protein